MRPSIGAAPLLIMGFLEFSCHVPLTLALLVALVGGTTLGAWLLNRRSLVSGVMCSSPQRHQPPSLVED